MKTESRHVVIVPGHITFGDWIDEYNPPSENELKTMWPYMVQTFQKEDEPAKLLEHLRFGIDLAKRLDAELVFSGGQTRESGWYEADTMRVQARVAFGFEDPRRLMLEKNARTSMGNVLYGLSEYEFRTGRPATDVHIPGWRFKRNRYDLVRNALGIAREQFHYYGVNDPNDIEGACKGNRRFEEPFRDDQFGRCESLFALNAERNGGSVLIDGRGVVARLLPLVEHINDPGTIGRTFAYPTRDLKILAA